jgi:regulator of sirC expression with transglutaminase-like and TPR domain
VSASINIDSAKRDWQSCVADHTSSEDDPTKLAEYALQLARILAYPDLDVKATLSNIDDMGGKIAHVLKKNSITRPTHIIEKINEYLFDIQKFSPNTDDYYNPLNSYLNIVLERKTGIPITLSILYMRIGQIAGFALLPVNFPAHFLIKHVMEGDNGEIIIDPFNKGRIMDDYALKALLKRSDASQNIAMTHAFVQRATTAQVMTRMLNNLKSSYYEAQDFERYELANEMVLAIDKYNPAAIRDKGIVFLQKGKTREALDILNSYLEIDPEAEDADEVLDVIRQIREGTYGKKK